MIPLIFHKPHPRMAFLLGVISLTCMVLMLWSRHGGPDQLAMTFTTVASVSFVLAAVTSGGLGHRYGRLMTAGLMLCAVADIIGPGSFMLGLYLFFLAHIGVMGAFISRGIDLRYFLASSLIMALVSLGVYFLWLGPNVPAEERIQVAAYTLVITVMLMFAGGSRSGAGKYVSLSGAILFYISDVFLANWRYVDTGRWNAFVCYPLYYLACVLLALSILSVSVSMNKKPTSSSIQA